MQQKNTAARPRGAERTGLDSRKGQVIQVRTSAETKAILNDAARLRGQTLSDFVIESARRRAEDTFLDQRVFFLDEDAHRQLLAILDNPPKPSAASKARMRRKPSWER